MTTTTAGPGVIVVTGAPVCSGAFDDLVADCAEVTRRLSTVPRSVPEPCLMIPDRAVDLVAALDSYGD